MEKHSKSNSSFEYSLVELHRKNWSDNHRGILGNHAAAL